MAHIIIQIDHSAVQKVLDAYDQEGTVYYFTAAGETLSLEVDGKCGGLELILRPDGTWYPYLSVDVGSKDD